MKTKLFNLFGHEWYCALEGNRAIHPDFPNAYYDDSAVKEINKNLVELTIHKNPTEIKHWDGYIYKPTYGAGVLKSVETFSYGVFEARIKMPKGRNLWPSFWLTGSESWPPEIDIVEGYTNRASSYLRGFSWRLESNVHYATDQEFHKQVGAKRLNLFKVFSSPIYNSLKYMVVWNKYRIDFYVENVLVRSITDPAVLEFINSSPYMHIVFQMGVPNNYNDKDLKSLKQPMIIENFRYTKLYQ